MLNVSQSVLFLGMVVLLVTSSGITVSAAEAPKVETVYPAGGQQGTEVEITLTGKTGDGTLQVATDPAQLQVVLHEDKATKATVTIPADARPGVHWLRFYNEFGTADLKPFVVGHTAEIYEDSDNNLLEDAPLLEQETVTVNGVLDRSGDVDIYGMTVPAGRTLVASVQANRELGSPMDTVMQLLDEQGTVIAQNDDDHAFDPQLAVQVPEEGDYFVRLFAFPSQPNSTVKLAGSKRYIYRLTLTHGPFVDHVLPAVVDQRSDAAITVCGWNLVDGQTTEGVSAFTEPVTHVGRQSALPVRVAGVSHGSLVESDASRALAVDSSVSGRIAAAGEVDTFTLPASKGQKLTFRMQARSLYSLLDPVLKIQTAEGKVLKEADDISRDNLDGVAEITVPADGPLTVSVTDRYGDGGFRYYYLLTCQESQPEVSATVAAGQYVLNQDEPLDVPVTIARKYSHKQKLTVTVSGLPEGVTAEPVVSEGEGDTSKKVTLKLQRGETAAAFSGPVQVQCQPEGEEAAFAATAAIATASKNLKPTTSTVWLTVMAPEKPAEPEPEAEAAEDKAEEPAAE